MPIETPNSVIRAQVRLPNVATMLLLLSYYYQDPKGLFISEPHLSSPTIQEACDWLHRHAMVDKDGCTDRGKLFVEHLARQPIPVPRTGWEMPSA